MKTPRSIWRRWLPILLVLLACVFTASAQTNNLGTNTMTTGFGPVQITLGGQNGPQDVDTGVKLLITLTEYHAVRVGVTSREPVLPGCVGNRRRPG